jgi:hypothetical protein
MAWAQRLGDESKRHQESVRVGLRWRTKKPGEFNRWLKESDLSEETRQTILRRTPLAVQHQIEQNNPNPAAASEP